MVRKRTACANRCAAAAAGGVTSLFGATSTCLLRRRTALTANTAMTTATISTATPDDFLIGPPERRRNSRPVKKSVLCGQACRRNPGRLQQLEKHFVLFDHAKLEACSLLDGFVTLFQVAHFRVQHCIARRQL